MSKPVKAVNGPLDNRRDIQDFFELTYANWLTIPRTLLQSMPEDWQKHFVELLDEFYEEMGWAMHLLPATNVQVLKHSPERLPDRDTCESCHGSGDNPEAKAEDDLLCEECDGDGTVEVEGDTFETPEEVGEIQGPIPHYQRGRATVPRAGDSIDYVMSNPHIQMGAHWLRANHIEEWHKIYGPEFKPGAKVEVSRHTYGHALPPVMQEVQGLGLFDGEVVNVVEGSDNLLYKVNVKLGPFEESHEIVVQLHVAQMKRPL